MTTTPWVAETIERRPITALLPYAHNARTHSSEQVSQIARSIQEFGWTIPVLIEPDGGIIAGHGRVLAAARLGMAEVPVIVVPAHWTEAQRRAYIIADNKLAENAGWDMDLLRVEIADLKAIDYDFSVIGFSDAELASLVNPPGGGGEDPEFIPPTPAVPVSQPGDVWLCGRHRIICGSSTDAATVERLLAGARPHLMVTDPPYGVEYDAAWRAKARNADGKLLSTGQHRAVGTVLNDDKADWTDAYRLFISHGGEVGYVWHGPNQTGIVAQGLMEAGLEIRAQIIWNKHHFVVGRGHYHPKHESCWYVVRKGASGHWQGGRKQSTVWDIEKPRKNDTGHSTQKPLPCMQIPIENNSLPGDGVFEPFSGSGTTMIACELTGRIAYSVELNPAYVDMAVLRWEQVSGGKLATHEGTGLTFQELRASRQADAA